jgi:hypothetical protein
MDVPWRVVGTAAPIPRHRLGYATTQPRSPSPCSVFFVTSAVRDDASDQMPISVGLGTFSYDMLTYVEDRPSSIDRILQDIDSNWI